MNWHGLARASDAGGVLTGCGMTVVLLCGVAGCGGTMEMATPGPADVHIVLPVVSEGGGLFTCGYRAAVQMIRYYAPDGPGREIDVGALNVEDAVDTVGVFHMVSGNVSCRMNLGKGSMEAMCQSLRSGHPVLAFVPADTFEARDVAIVDRHMYHCVVVAGRDREGKALYVYSDGKGPYRISSEAFNRKWRRSGNLCIMAGKLGR